MDLFAQLVRSIRFGYEGAAGFEFVDLAEGVEGIARGEQHRHVGRALADHLNEFAATHVGHDDIGNHQFDLRMGLELLQCIQPV